MWICIFLVLSMSAPGQGDATAEPTAPTGQEEQAPPTKEEEPQEPKVHEKQEESATVTFNCQTHAVTVSKNKFTVPYDYQLILTLDLKTTGGDCTAAFPPGNGAFDFPKGGPPGFTVKRESDTEVVLTEINNDKKDAEYCFKAVVASGGEEFKSPDPTIINLGGGG